MSDQGWSIISWCEIVMGYWSPCKIINLFFIYTNYNSFVNLCKIKPALSLEKQKDTYERIVDLQTMLYNTIKLFNKKTSINNLLR